jgi:hypothetical protein
MDIINLNRPYLFKKVLPDNIDDPLLSKNLVIFARFIQNQAQRGPRSASLVVGDPDGRDLLLIFDGFPEHFSGFLRNVEHAFPPVKN